MRRVGAVSTTPIVVGFAVAALLMLGLVVWLVYDDGHPPRRRKPLRSTPMRWDVRDKNADKARARIDTKLDTVIDLLGQISFQLTTRTDQGEEIVADLAALQASVDTQSSVIDGAVALIQGLSQALKDAIASNDPAAIQAVVDQLDSNTNELAAAVDNVPHAEQR